MAEMLRQPVTAVLEFNGIRVECAADGTMTVFIPPELYTVTTRAGRGNGQSGRLLTAVVIAPLIDQSPNSKPTQTGLNG